MLANNSSRQRLPPSEFSSSPVKLSLMSSVKQFHKQQQTPQTVIKARLKQLIDHTNMESIKSVERLVSVRSGY